MNTITCHADLQGQPAQIRIAYYTQELERITPPRNYREQVLRNVYRSLLQSTLTRESMTLETMPSLTMVDAALFVAVENNVSAVKTWSYRGYALRQLRLLGRFIMRQRQQDRSALSQHNPADIIQLRHMNG
jgi:hypothetical protein